MTESEFLEQADAILSKIEAAFDRMNDEDIVDVECKRSGNVLELEFIDTSSKIIINSQAPMKEMWVAARAGGYHYRNVDGQWRDTRDGSELFAALSKLASGQTGVELTVA